MNKYLIILSFLLSLASCSTTHKHKRVEQTKTDSLVNEASTQKAGSSITASVATVQTDSSNKQQVVEATINKNTTISFVEIPGNAEIRFPTPAEDYFPLSFKTPDGKQFVAVPNTSSQEKRKTVKQENAGSAKSTTTQIAAIDTGSNTTAKTTELHQQTSVKDKDVERSSFSWWWLILIAAAVAVYLYRKPIWAFIKRLIPFV